MGDSQSTALKRRLDELGSALAAAYLAYLLWLHFDPDADPRELFERGKSWASGKWDERAQWTRTLRGIRDLPETEEK